jgi:hypothetical protein
VVLGKIQSFCPSPHPLNPEFPSVLIIDLHNCNPNPVPTISLCFLFESNNSFLFLEVLLTCDSIHSSN